MAGSHCNCGTAQQCQLVVMVILACSMSWLVTSTNSSAPQHNSTQWTKVENQLDDHQVTRQNAKVTLQACCNGHCVTFDRLAAMVGVECCGDEPASLINKICCKGTLHDRRDGYRYYDRCCGSRPYATDQTCCEGAVHDGVGLACCREAAYNLYDKKKICCDGQLYSIPSDYVTTACCGNMIYNAWDGSELCCGSKVYSSKLYNACCVSDVDEQNAQAIGYNTQTQLCCNGVHDKRLFDSCCYVSEISTADWAPPTAVPYSTQTHRCDVDGVYATTDTINQP